MCIRVPVGEPLPQALSINAHEKKVENKSRWRATRNELDENVTPARLYMKITRSLLPEFRIIDYGCLSFLSCSIRDF